MMNRLLAMDAWLIDRVFQPVADWLARWASCYAIAEFLLVGCVVADAAYGIGRGGACLVIAGVMGLCDGTAILTARRAARETRDGMLPAVRLEYVGLRVMVACLLLVFLPVPLLLGAPEHPASWFLAARNHLFLAALYFMACRRNPPRQRQRQTAGSWAWGGA